MYGPAAVLVFSFVAASLIEFVDAGRECVWIIGEVKCEKDPKKNLNVEIRVYDKDSFFPLSVIDPDDLMGVTFSNDDGRFQLDGCGDDYDWLPGVKNTPDPFIEIRHYCNSDKGEVLTLPEFARFVPDTYEVGTVILDSASSSPAAARNPSQANRTP